MGPCGGGGGCRSCISKGVTQGHRTVKRRILCHCWQCHIGVAYEFKGIFCPDSGHLLCARHFPHCTAFHLHPSRQSRGLSLCPNLQMRQLRFQEKGCHLPKVSVSVRLRLEFGPSVSESCPEAAGSCSAERPLLER